MQPEHEAYWEALRVADRPAALAAVVSAQQCGAGPPEIIEELIVPAQAQIGELWRDGEWSVEDEQAATRINEDLVRWASSTVPPPAPDAPLVLVSCIEHERHALPTLVVAGDLGRAGYRVHLLPEDQQPGDPLRDALVNKPRAVLFSASLTSSLATQKSLVAGARGPRRPPAQVRRRLAGHRRRDNRGRDARLVRAPPEAPRRAAGPGRGGLGLLAEALRGHPLARLRLAAGAPVTAPARRTPAEGNEEAVA